MSFDIGTITGGIKLNDDFLPALDKVVTRLEVVAKKIDDLCNKIGVKAHKSLPGVATDADKAVQGLKGLENELPKVVQKETELDNSNKKVSQSTKKLGDDQTRLKTKLKETESGVDKLIAKLNKTGGAFSSAGSELTKFVTLPLAALAGGSTKLSSDFSSSMAKMETLVGLSRETVAGFRDDIMRIAHDTGKAPIEVADALYFLTSAGLSAQQSLDALLPSAQASALGLGEVKVMADASSSAVNAYGIENLSAAKAINIMGLAVKAGKLEATDLAPVLGRVIPIAAAMKIRFEDVNGVLAVMSRTGLDAAMASVSLSTFLSALLNPSDDADKVLKKVGLSMHQLREEVQLVGRVALQNLV